MSDLNISQRYKVESIDSKETYDWLRYKHYAHRIPPINYAFGLFENNVMVGVCTFGRPVAFTLIKNALGGGGIKIHSWN